MTAYFHGGTPGLRVGGFILPPTETGAKSLSDVTGAPPELLERVHRVHRRDRVYLALNVEDAKLFAAFDTGGCCHRGGDVYRVDPVGDIEPDPDWLGPPGGSICAPRARIVGIAATGVRRAPYLMAALLNGHLD